MDADVEPEPCRDCGRPTHPNMGWCPACDVERREREADQPMDPDDFPF